MCPDDRLLYALRDVTGTVPSIPLITASILSKKLAEGISALILDVKFGSAAFMQTRAQARELAATMTQIAREFGVNARALLTDMNSPLGRAAGNWLEVKESVECLEGRGPEDLRKLVIACAAHLLVMTGRSKNVEDAAEYAQSVLASGQPRRKWDDIVAGQGGDLKAFHAKLERDHTAPYVAELKAKSSGWVSHCDARMIGELIRDLGGGRTRKEAAVDGDVGVDRIAGVGESIAAGDVLCRLHVREAAQIDEGLSRLERSFAIATAAVAPRDLIVEVV